VKVARGNPYILTLLLAGIGAFASPVRAEQYSNESPDSVDPALREQLMQAVARADSFRDRFNAEVWLSDMSTRLSRQVPDVDERLEILTAVHKEATRADLPPELVLAVIDVESNFDRFAISRANALGLMQVMPFWVSELEIGDGDKNQLFDIETNVLLGCRILKYYLDLEHGDYMQGLARYNGSRGLRDYADRVIKRLTGKWLVRGD
jgi:soluble lytic murein transglycosylase-like protein